MARAEVDREGGRQRAAYRQSQAKGEPLHGRMLGYGPGGAIIEDEAELVRNLFAQFVAGRGVNGLVNELNAAAVPTSGGTKWSRDGLTWLLRDPRYVGQRARLVGPSKGSRTELEVITEGRWTAIIDPETFAAAQARFTKSLSSSKRLGSHKVHLGSGLLLCGVCGGRVVSYYKHYTKVDGTRVTTRRYKCAASGHLVRQAEPIDQLIIGEVVAYLRSNDLAAMIADDRDAAESRRLHDKLAGDPEREIEAEMAEILVRRTEAGQRSALALVAAAADPGLAWLTLRDTDLTAAQAVVATIATITMLPGKRGRAGFDPATVQIEWVKHER
ncbi:recombinase family protein [Nakamurella sp. GG22]